MKNKESPCNKNCSHQHEMDSHEYLQRVIEICPGPFRSLGQHISVYSPRNNIPQPDSRARCHAWAYWSMYAILHSEGRTLKLVWRTCSRMCEKLALGFVNGLCRSHILRDIFKYIFEQSQNWKIFSLLTTLVQEQFQVPCGFDQARRYTW
jgi:hypothetical protein